MRFMVFVKMAEDVREAPAELQQVMGTELAQAFASGSVIAAGGCIRPPRRGIGSPEGGSRPPTARSPGQEVVGGYSILEARSQAGPWSARRVAEIHQQYWPGWEGSVGFAITDAQEGSSSPT
jgi:hypothetical protein